MKENNKKFYVIIIDDECDLRPCSLLINTIRTLKTEDSYKDLEVREYRKAIDGIEMVKKVKKNCFAIVDLRMLLTSNEIFNVGDPTMNGGSIVIRTLEDIGIKYKPLAYTNEAEFKLNADMAALNIKGVKYYQKGSREARAAIVEHIRDAYAKFKKL